MTNKIRNIQLIQLEIAKEFKRICEKHDLKYFLIYGSLIGAVRHKGFIPWDDDIDIGMPREDYDRFIKLCKNELNHNYYLQCMETDHEYWQPFAKIRKNNTYFEEKSTKNISTHKGVYIDVFPLDYVNRPGAISSRLQHFFVKLLKHLIYKKQNIKAKYDKSIVLLFLSMITKKVSAGRLKKIQHKTMTFYNKKKGGFLVCFGGWYSLRKETIPIEKFMPGKKLLFEGELFSAPLDYDYVLSRIYGDYMTLPPKEERTNQHIINIIATNEH